MAKPKIYPLHKLTKKLLESGPVRGILIQYAPTGTIYKVRFYSGYLGNYLVENMETGHRYHAESIAEVKDIIRLA